MRLLALVVVMLSLGCSKKEAAPIAPPVAAVAAPAPAPTAAAGPIGGKVIQTLEAPGYTYLQLSTPSGEQWAAIPTTPVPVGTEVTLANVTPMTDFTSKTLNRTFPLIYFASGIVGQGPGAAPGAHPKADGEMAALAAWADKGAPAGPAPSPTGAAPAGPVAKATGADAKTVAEIFKQRTALKDKTVAVRGKVVKYTAGVMGKNWLHLQDGSGSAETKDNDLTVTTSGVAAVGDVVSVRGPVHLERDFGAGYVFAVIIEDAQIVP